MEKLTQEQAGGFVEGTDRIKAVDQYRKIFEQNPKELRQPFVEAGIEDIDGYRIDDLLDKLFKDPHFKNKNEVEYSGILIGKLVDAHIENLKKIDKFEKGE